MAKMGRPKGSKTVNRRTKKLEAILESLVSDNSNKEKIQETNVENHDAEQRTRKPRQRNLTKGTTARTKNPSLSKTESRRDEDFDESRNDQTPNYKGNQLSGRNTKSDYSRPDYRRKPKEHREYKKDDESGSVTRESTRRSSRREDDSGDSRNEYTHRRFRRKEGSDESGTEYSERSGEYQRSRGNDDSDSRSDYPRRRSKRDDYSDHSRYKYSRRRSWSNDDSDDSRSEYVQKSRAYQGSRKGRDSYDSRNEHSRRGYRRDDDSDNSKSEYSQDRKDHYRSKRDDSNDEYSYSRSEPRYERRRKTQATPTYHSRDSYDHKRDSFKKNTPRRYYNREETHNEMIEIPRKPKSEAKDELCSSKEQDKTGGDQERGTVDRRRRGARTSAAKSKKEVYANKGPEQEEVSQYQTQEGGMKPAPERLFNKVHIFPRSHWKALPPTTTVPFVTQPSNVQFTFNGSPCTNPAECIRTLQDIQKDHMKKGLSDIAYNFMIGLDSNVYEGRGWNTKPEVIVEENIAGEEPLSDSNVIVSFLGEPIQFFKHMKAVNKGHELVCYGFENHLLYVPKEYHPNVFPKNEEDDGGLLDPT